VREGYGKLVAFVERVSCLPPDQVADFLGSALLVDRISALDLDRKPGQNESCCRQRLIGSCAGSRVRLLNDGVLELEEMARPGHFTANGYSEPPRTP
jgi:hypothetical protein